MNTEINAADAAAINAILPADMPELSIEVFDVEGKALNGGYRLRLDGIGLPGYPGRSSGSGTTVVDLKRSITTHAAQYIYFARTKTWPALDKRLAEMLAGRLGLAMSHALALRLDVIVLGQGTHSPHITFELFSDATSLGETQLDTHEYRPAAPKEGRVLNAGPGEVGYASFAVQVEQSKEGWPHAWTIERLERAGGPVREAGLVSTKALPTER